MALPLSTHSAVEMLHDSALYKFMIDIDIGIDIPWPFPTPSLKTLEPFVFSYAEDKQTNKQTNADRQLFD